MPSSTILFMPYLTQPALCFVMSFILISKLRDRACDAFPPGILQSAAAISRFRSSLHEHEMKLQYCFTNLSVINCGSESPLGCAPGGWTVGWAEVLLGTPGVRDQLL